MISDKIELIVNKISSLEKKINRIEELLLLLVEEDYLSEDEKKRIAQADETIKTKELLIPEEESFPDEIVAINSNEETVKVDNLFNLDSTQQEKMNELWDNEEDEVWNDV
jgi:hypothetical protein